VAHPSIQYQSLDVTAVLLADECFVTWSEVPFASGLRKSSHLQVTAITAAAAVVGEDKPKIFAKQKFLPR
jgi:shikimate kinase